MTTKTVTKRKVSRKSRAKSAETNKIKDLLVLGVSGTEIAADLGCNVSRVYSIAKYYRKEIERRKSTLLQPNISNYEEDTVNLLKYNIVRVGNAISNKDITKYNITQLTNSMSTMIDKLRLMEGKSTANIATNILHNVNDEQLDIIKSSIKSLKESMLNSDND